MIQHLLLAATDNEIPQPLKESTMWPTIGHIPDCKYDQVPQQSPRAFSSIIDERPHLHCDSQRKLQLYEWRALFRLHDLRSKRCNINTKKVPHIKILGYTGNEVNILGVPFGLLILTFTYPMLPDFGKKKEVN